MCIRWHLNLFKNQIWMHKTGRACPCVSYLFPARLIYFQLLQFFYSCYLSLLMYIVTCFDFKSFFFNLALARQILNIAGLHTRCIFRMNLLKIIMIRIYLPLFRPFWKMFLLHTALEHFCFINFFHWALVQYSLHL